MRKHDESIRHIFLKLMAVQRISGLYEWRNEKMTLNVSISLVLQGGQTNIFFSSSLNKTFKLILYPFLNNMRDVDRTLIFILMMACASNEQSLNRKKIKGHKNKAEQKDQKVCLRGRMDGQDFNSRLYQN